jgi:uncharacterized protein YjbI with pentapeptide repeats
MMDADKLRQALAEHKLWVVSNRKQGARADLSWANLCWADLSWADLRWANLYGADLSWANLYGADLSWADLRGAKGIRVITPDGSRGDMLKAIIHADGWHIYTGCFGDTLAEFEAAVERDHANDKWGTLYRADIAMLRATEQVFLDEMREWEVNRG